MEAKDTEKIRTAFFYVVLVTVTLAFFYMLKTFFFAIFWAAVIAILFSPLYRRLHGWTSAPNLSASLVLVVIVLLIILPAVLVGTLLVGESLMLYDSIDSGPLGVKLKIFLIGIKNHPFLDRLHIDEALLTQKIADIAKGVTNFIVATLSNLTQNTFVFIVKFGVMLYALYFFIRDGKRFVGALGRMLPIGDARGRRLFERFAATSRATLKVTVIIGGLQGALGGILFFVTGIEGALIWGLLMIFFSVIPGIGCSIVWAPAGVILLATGHLWEGITILAAGVFVISMVDNLLRPILLGRDVQMHALLIFLSTLGGIAVFGVSGFILGPILAALLLAVWEMHGESQAEDEQAQAKTGG
jgi:predicted PurR-regulated permease PerM